MRSSKLPGRGSDEKKESSKLAGLRVPLVLAVVALGSAALVASAASCGDTTSSGGNGGGTAGGDLGGGGSGDGGFIE